MLKHVSIQNLKILFNSLNLAWKQKKIPKLWGNLRIIVILKKKGDINAVNMAFKCPE